MQCASEGLGPIEFGGREKMELGSAAFIATGPMAIHAIIYLGINAASPWIWGGCKVLLPAHSTTASTMPSEMIIAWKLNDFHWDFMVLVTLNKSSGPCFGWRLLHQQFYISKERHRVAALHPRCASFPKTSAALKPWLLSHGRALWDGGRVHCLYVSKTPVRQSPFLIS